MKKNKLKRNDKLQFVFMYNRNALPYSHQRFDKLELRIDNFIQETPFLTLNQAVKKM